MIEIGLYDIVKSTTPESNKSPGSMDGDAYRTGWFRIEHVTLRPKYGSIS